MGRKVYPIYIDYTSQGITGTWPEIFLRVNVFGSENRQAGCAQIQGSRVTDNEWEQDTWYIQHRGGLARVSRKQLESQSRRAGFPARPSSAEGFRVRSPSAMADSRLWATQQT